MEKQFLLDLNNAKVPGWWPEGVPLVLPVKPGGYELDLDLNVEAIGAENYKKLFDATAHFNEGRKDTMPIGFDLDRLPVGAVLRRIS